MGEDDDKGMSPVVFMLAVIAGILLYIALFKLKG